MRRKRNNYRINIRRIKKHQTYSRKEISITLNRHPDTVQNWCTHGLTPIDPNRHPLEYKGADIHDFYNRKIQIGKRTCSDNEIYCRTCRVCTTVDAVDIRTVETGFLLSPNVKQVIIYAKCPKCNNRIQRFSSTRKAPEFLALYGISGVCE